MMQRKRGLAVTTKKKITEEEGDRILKQHLAAAKESEASWELLLEDTDIKHQQFSKLKEERAKQVAEEDYDEDLSSDVGDGAVSSTVLPNSGEEKISKEEEKKRRKLVKKFGETEYNRMKEANEIERIANLKQILAESSSEEEDDDKDSGSEDDMSDDENDKKVNGKTPKNTTKKDEKKGTDKKDAKNDDGKNGKDGKQKKGKKRAKGPGTLAARRARRVKKAAKKKEKERQAKLVAKGIDPDRYKTLKVEGETKPRSIDTRRLCKYVDHDEPEDLVAIYGGNFRATEVDPPPSSTAAAQAKERVMEAYDDL